MALVCQLLIVQVLVVVQHPAQGQQHPVAIVAQAQATSAQASAPQQDRSLTISGIDSSSLYSGDQLLQLMENINGAVEDGYVLKAS